MPHANHMPTALTAQVPCQPLAAACVGFVSRSNRGAVCQCSTAASQQPSTSSQAQPTAPSRRAAASKVPVPVLFKPEMKTVEALPGDFFADVAEQAGVDVQLGCNQGNCGVCELELEKFSKLADGRVVGGGTQVIRACIARVPPGFARLELNAMTDQIWGVDGFDT